MLESAIACFTAVTNFGVIPTEYADKKYLEIN
jgi:hypothetical protein